MAQKHDQKILSQCRLITDPSITSRVETIVSKLVQVSHKKNMRPIVRIVDADTENAFVTGGEYVYVFKGLLDTVESDDELAGILGHELAHLSARHAARTQRSVSWTNLGFLITGAITKELTHDKNIHQMLGSIQQLIHPLYSREHEREADVLGVIYARNAGYNPARFTDFFGRNLKKQEEMNRTASHLLQISQHAGQSYKTCEHCQRQHELYRTPETQAAFLTAQNAYTQTFEELESARNQYIKLASQDPLLRTHPIDQERIAIVTGVNGYLNGKQPLNSLRFAPIVSEVFWALQQVEAKGVMTSPGASSHHAHNATRSVPKGSTKNTDKFVGPALSTKVEFRDGTSRDLEIFYYKESDSDAWLSIKSNSTDETISASLIKEDEIQRIKDLLIFDGTSSWWPKDSAIVKRQIEAKQRAIEQTDSAPVPKENIDTATWIICSQDVDAFNPTSPSEQIGRFDKGDKLKIEDANPKDGMILVSHTQADGTVIRALCRSQDLGL